MSPRKKKAADENIGEQNYETVYKEDKKQREYKGHIPSGCAACGGPYPSCMSSCPMFDD